MVSPATTPGPVASKATASNISLLLASRQALVRKSLLSRPGATSAAATAAAQTHRSERAEWEGANRPNDGVGFVASEKAKEETGALKKLRGRLLGKNGKEIRGDKRRAREASVEDEDEGRSGLGKKKKARRALEAVDDEPAPELPQQDVPDGEAESTRIVSEAEAPAEVGTGISPAAAATGAETEGVEKRKKKKNKKKRKRTAENSG